ncbi:MAG: L-arabinose isomerase [Spirochaetales bacterium]|nr:L-arabinose isomerase [Spirochaetales bacterium]
MAEIRLNGLEVWFYAGSQHLYGPGPLQEVTDDASRIAAALDASVEIPVTVRYKGVLTSAEEITRAIAGANDEVRCIGVIVWMHTFSPAKMWIAGLRRLAKPLLHFHTQYGRDIPWRTIDMDFMNLHQTAHGGREFGFLATRMGLRRKVVTGHWESSAPRERIGVWARAAAAWADGQGARIARFGDNMRDVAVTEGDKVAAEMTFGYSVNGYGMGDVAARLHEVTDGEIDRLVAEYADRYTVAAALMPGGERHDSLRYAARLEATLRAFLEDGGFVAFTDTFENLHGFDQLPGLPVQRLMAEGYGFGAEGDWKTAALLRAMKVMAAGLPGGTSFMEDYTYHFEPGRERVLGAHMLEICPSIAAGKPTVEIHPLGIGGKADPVRLVFDSPPGEAINASIIDLGDRFRLIVNAVDAVAPDEPLPRLPVARTVWIPRPDLETAATAWIYAGGAHHTGFSRAVTAEMLEDYADIAGVEMVLIDETTRLGPFRRELRLADSYGGLKSV